jgi:hypothetical protein
MNITYSLADFFFESSSPPPPGGWLDDLPEAFGALDEKGEVFIIGYKGEWYVPVKPKPRVRIRNWLLRIGDRKERS